MLIIKTYIKLALLFVFFIAEQITLEYAADSSVSSSSNQPALDLPERVSTLTSLDKISSTSAFLDQTMSSFEVTGTFLSEETILTSSERVKSCEVITDTGVPETTHDQCPYTATQTVIYTSTITQDVITPTCTDVTSHVLEYSETGSSMGSINMPEMLRNLTVDVRHTSAFTRRLKSANDTRKSCVVMGWVGVVSVLVPIVLIILSDMKYRECFTSRQHLNQVKAWY